MDAVNSLRDILNARDYYKTSVIPAEVTCSVFNFIFGTSHNPAELVETYHGS